MILTGLGFLIWKLQRVLPLSRLVQTLQSVNAHWICLKLANGSGTYNQIDAAGQLVWDDDYLLEVIETLRVEIPGLQVGGWQWIFTRGTENMSSQAERARERCAALGLDFWLIDAEENQSVGSYWKTSATRDQSAREYMTNIRDVPSPALCSYRYPESHRELPWSEFINPSFIEYTAPQVYWIGSHNPRYQLTKCLQQYDAIRDLPMIPIGAAFKEGGWTTTPAEIAEFTQACQDLNLPGWGYWVLDQAIDRPDWLAAMVNDYIPPPNPDPEPEPEPQTIEITGLHSGDSLNLRAAIFGAVVAHTWNGARFPVMSTGYDSQGRAWYQIGAGIWVAGWYTKAV